MEIRGHARRNARRTVVIRTTNVIIMRLTDLLRTRRLAAKAFKGTLVASVALVALLVAAPSDAHAADTGIINVCKMIVADGTVATSSAGLPAGEFSVFIGYKEDAASATTTVGTVDFDASTFAPNTKIVSSTENDAQCVVASSTLAFTTSTTSSYIYDAEQIVGSGWGTPHYNDQFTSTVTSTSTFFVYDMTGDKNADGFMSIGTSTPERTLVILNSYSTSATTSPTTTPATPSNGGSGGSSGGRGGGSASLRITDEDVEEVVPGIAMVTWETNRSATSQVVYGTESVSDSDIDEDDEGDNFGYDNSTIELEDRLTSHGVAVGGLRSDTTYYFRPVSRRGNDVEVGDEVALRPDGDGGAGQSCVYLYDYIKRGWENNENEVRKLQIFLRDMEGHSNLEITGKYDDATFWAVSAFQEKYSGDILAPWGHERSTGFVYILTKKKINEIYCKTVFSLTPEQQQEIVLFRNFLDSLKSEGVTSGGTVIPPRTGEPAPYEGQTTEPQPGDDGGVIEGEGEIGLGSGTGTPTGTTTESELPRGIIGNLAAAVFSLPDSGTEITRCIFNLVIILAIIYIVTSILVGSDDATMTGSQVRFRKLMFFLGGVIIALAFALFFDMFCLILPLVVVLVLTGIGMIWSKYKGGKTETPDSTKGGGSIPPTMPPLIVEQPKKSASPSSAAPTGTAT